MLLLPPEETEKICSPEHLALHEDLRRGWHAKTVLALSTQARLAATFGELGPQHNEVLGQLTMVVDKALYQEMRRQYGDDCWKDKSFRRRFAADNPAANIRSKSRKTTVMVHASALEPVKSVPSVSSVPTPVPVCAP